MPTNLERFDAWLALLESGTKKQTRSVLKNSHGYCCLGVLCEMMEVPHIDLDNASEFTFTLNAELEQTHRTYVFPPIEIVADWFGLNFSVASFLANGAAKMNDDGASFVEIAAWIRKGYRNTVAAT